MPISDGERSRELFSGKEHREILRYFKTVGTISSCQPSIIALFFPCRIIYPQNEILRVLIPTRFLPMPLAIKSSASDQTEICPIRPVFPNACRKKPAEFPPAVSASRASAGLVDIRRKPSPFSLRHSPAGFSLIEVLVSFAVLALIMVMLLSITNVTSKTWKGTTEKMQSFEDVRAAFDRITSLIGQATLNPYWDYDDLQNPTKYERASELQFLSLPMALLPKDAAAFPTHGIFFQAPTGKVANQTDFGGLPLLLNAYGYFVEYGPDERPSWLPASVTPKYRFRLKEWRAPSESWTLYQHSSGANGKTYLGSDSYNWIDLTAPAAKTLAENVIALVIYPKNTENASTVHSLAEADTFVYNSRTASATTEGKNQKHQLPPEVEVIMVAIDEASAIRKWNNAIAAPALTAGLFQKPADLEDNLKTLTDSLNSQNIKYITLRSTVKIRGARWSQ